MAHFLVAAMYASYGRTQRPSGARYSAEWHPNDSHELVLVERKLHGRRHGRRRAAHSEV